MDSLKQTVKRYLAWKSIKEDSEDLNLDAAQNRETDNNLIRFNRTVDDQIKEAYCWLLVPYIDKNVDLKTIVWDATRISGGSDSIVAKAAKKMLQNEQIITKWAPMLLLMELDNLLWKESNHISIKQLWEYLCTYCYLPRLANETVLLEAIQKGINFEEYFAHAAGFDETRYIDLKHNQYIGIVEKSGYLVKASVAMSQLAEEKAKRKAETPLQGGSTPIYPANNENTTTDVSAVSDGGTGPNETGTEIIINQPTNRKFFMSAQLDTTRIGRDVQRLVEEVISHLTALDGANIELSLELNVTSPESMSQQLVRTVTENCRTLKVKSFGFDE